MEDKAKPKFTIEPYVGAKPIEFGMTTEAVRKTLTGEPTSVARYEGSTTVKNEYYFDDVVRIHYDESEQVDEISFVPRGGISLFFDGNDLFDEKAGRNPLTLFLQIDPRPLEDVGFIVFEKLGVAVTGYHDKDRSQRAITIFKQGRWTDLDEATPIDLSRFAV